MVPSPMLAILAWALVQPAAADESLIVPRDLDNRYSEIFKTGNRNAASHLWTSFVVGHAPKMPHVRFYNIFRGFCSVSGSPIPDDPHTMYKTTLNRIHNGTATGVVRFCCWPCICDMNEHVRVDTKTIQTADGRKEYEWLVIGDPCKHADKLKETFKDPFSGVEVGLNEAAPELECTSEGKLRGATFSDHGHVIIGMFFTDQESLDAIHPVSIIGPEGKVPAVEDDPTFGFASMCQMRKDQGYNSGMGMIFHLVAKINPIGEALPLGAGAPTVTSDITEQVEIAPRVALPPARPLFKEQSPPVPFALAVLFVAAVSISVVFKLRRPRGAKPSTVNDEVQE